MALSVAQALTPQGWRTGSPIELVEQSETFGFNQLSETVRVPVTAQPGDVMVLMPAWGGFSGSWTLSSITSIPSGFWTFLHSTSGFDASHTNYVSLYYHIVQDGEAGRSAGLSWNQTQQVNIDMTVTTWRHAWLGGGFNSNANGTTGTGTTNIASDVLVISTGGSVQVFSYCGTPDNEVPLDGVRADGGINMLETMLGGAVGFFHLVGAVDEATPASPGYTRNAVVFSGSPPTNQTCSAVAASIVLPPMPAPSAPVYTITPSSTSLDLAQVAGTPVIISWVNSFLLGQGPQSAWAIGRQVNTTNASPGWWNADLNVWEDAANGVYWNFGEATSYTLPPSAFANDGTNWDLYGSVAAADLGLNCGLVSIATVQADPPPNVLPTAPTGSPTSAGPVTWTPILGAGLSEIAYEVQIFSSDQYGLTGFSTDNLLSVGDSDFEQGIGTWTAVGATPTWGSTLNYTGAHDLKLTAVGTSGFTAQPASFAVTATRAYFARARVAADATARQVTPELQWVAVDGHIISTSSGTPTNDGVGSYVHVEVGGTAPAGAVKALLVMSWNASAASEVHRIDTVRVQTTPAPRSTPGVVNSAATTWTPSPVLRGGAYYRAFVSIRQTGGQWSAFESIDWYANYNGCATPTISAVAGTDPVTGCPRAVLTVTGHDSSTLTNTTYVNLFRYNAVTTALDPVRFSQGVAIPWPSQVVTLYDYEMTPNTLVEYQAQVYSTSPTGP